MRSACLRSLPLHDAGSPGVDSRLGAVSDVQLAQDVVDVALDRALADHEPLGDVDVVQPLRHQLQHLSLPGAESLIELFGAVLQQLHRPARVRLTDSPSY